MRPIPSELRANDSRPNYGYFVIAQPARKFFNNCKKCWGEPHFLWGGAFPNEGNSLTLTLDKWRQRARSRGY